MQEKSLLDIVSKLGLLGAGLGIAIGLFEWLVNLAGFSLIGELHTPGRIMEVAAILLILVIAVTLRQILRAIQSATNI